MEDQPADSGDLTTGAEESSPGDDLSAEVSEAPAQQAPARRRRWFSLRRRAKAPEPAKDPAPEDVVDDDEPKPAPRTPVGKRDRTAKARVPSEDSVEEPTREEPTGEQNDEAEQPAEEAAPEPVLVPHRPAGKRLMIAAVAAGVLFVGAAAFAGATLQPYLADRAEVDTKLDVARTAADAISTLWTYTPDDMESLPDRSAGFLGGDFAHEYRKYIDAIVAPNKQAQVTNTTEVMGAAVESLNQSEATAIVYTNSVATSPRTKNIPSLRYLSYRLTMERRDAEWLITHMSTVTSLDLTPQL